MTGELERRAVLLDIEGTTTPIAFVTTVLFPYARRRLAGHLARHRDRPEYRTLLAELRDEWARDRAAAASVPPWPDEASRELDGVVAYCGWLMDRDRKSTSLKRLQGCIWEEGYASGELTGELFEDVAPAFVRWHADGVDIGLFSSGSRLAQQLLFRHSTAGDLSAYLGWYFDTTTGAKGEADSYRRIAHTMARSAHAVSFVSDVVAELDAARAAGMRTALSVRPGNAPASGGHEHPVVHSLAELTDLSAA
ncbi:MAG: acireductone synthase [Acidobacteriota bacterium]